MMTRHIVMYSTGIGSWASAHRVVTKFGAFRERLDQQPALFDTDDWGGCGCFVDGDGSD